jgi:DNA-binding protein HU-beta
MSKAFMANVLQESPDLTGTAARSAANAIIDSLVSELKKNGKFTIPGFGTFKVARMKARKAMNPRTGEPIKVKASKAVRFKASPVLKKSV